MVSKQTLILLLCCLLCFFGSLLSAQHPQLPVPELEVGMSYGVPDFSIQTEIQGIRFETCNRPTHTYVSPYLVFDYMHIRKPAYGFGIKSGLQGWKADYLLNVEMNSISSTPLPSSISFYYSDFGITAYQRYGRITLTQSISLLVGNLRFRVRDLENKWYDDDAWTMGGSGEVGFKYRLTRNESICLGYQRQVFASEETVFTPDQGLDLVSKFGSPVTMFKIGIELNQDDVSRGIEWLKNHHLYY